MNLRLLLLLSTLAVRYSSAFYVGDAIVISVDVITKNKIVVEIITESANAIYIISLTNTRHCSRAI